MMNCVLIVTNFNAGRKKALKYKKKVIDFVLKYTKTFKFADIDELKELDTSPYDTILVMGGDGTVNKVLPYLVNTDKILGIIPCGTANLLAAKLGLSSNLSKNLRVIEKNNVKLIDIMKLNEHLCALRCGFGYDSDIICKTPQSLKNKFGYFAYFIAGIIFALKLKNKEYKITIDNEKSEMKASCIIIANGSNMYRNLVSVGNKSELDDGVGEVFILQTENPVIFYFEFLNIIMGIRNSNSVAEYRKFEKIDIENSWQVCHIDGEKKNLRENINIKILNKAIRVFVKNMKS